MFRMPDWMSEDDDMSHLASRMSQSPHFATPPRRGGPWRERRNSGGSSTMSGAPDDAVGDSVDGPHRHHSTPIQIPIRIEAEAPPGCIQTPPMAAASPPEHSKPNLPNELQPQPPGQIPTEPSQLCMGQLRKQPQYASRTTSAVNAISQDDVPRDARAASAPPDMADPLHPQKYVYKMKVPTSDKSPLGSSPVFNNVPKPYFKVTEEKTPIPEEPTVILKPSSASQQVPSHCNEAPPPPPSPKQSQPQHNNYQPPWGSGTGKSSVVRNIPILIEGRDEGSAKPPMQESHPPSDWEHPFGSPSSFRFSSAQEPHRDPFFDLPSKMTSHQMPPHQMPPHQVPQNYPPPCGSSFEHPQETASPPFEEPMPQPAPTAQMEEDLRPSEPVDRKMEKIAEVRKSVTEYQDQIKKFTGVKTDKEYIYLDEMLTRALLQLDNIDPDGRDDVRQARKTLVKDINDTIVAMEKMSRSAGVEGPQEMNACPPAESAAPVEGSSAEMDQVETTKPEGSSASASTEDAQSMEHETSVPETKNDLTEVVEPIVAEVAETST